MTNHTHSAKIMADCSGALSALRSATARLCATVETKEDFQQFMSRHGFAVWDFMTLAYSVLDIVRPRHSEHRPWVPAATPPKLLRAIQEMIACEECDTMPDGTVISHYGMYIMAMKEAGADTKLLTNTVSRSQMTYNYQLPDEVPVSVRSFTQVNLDQAQRRSTTSDLRQAINFAFGRENIIPEMFQMMIDRFNLTKEEMPTFFYYLERHIEVDGDEHGRAAFDLVDLLVDHYLAVADDTWLAVPTRLARQAILHRAAFFNAIADEIIATR